MGDWKQKARERVKEKQQGATFKLTPGPNCFRVAQNSKGPNYPPFEEIHIHRDVGPDKRVVRCGKKMDGTGKCWLCDLKLPELRKSAKTSKQAYAEQMAQQEQMITQVFPFNPDNEKFSPAKPWWVSTGGPKSLSVALMSLISGSRRSYDDPVKGYNISCNRTGTGMKDTKYGALEPDEEPTVVPKEIRATVKPFEEIVPQYSMADQKAAFFGEEAAAEEQEEETEETEEETEETEEEAEEEAEEETEEEAEEEAEEETEEETEEEAEEEAEEETEEEETEEEEAEEEETEEETEETEEEETEETEEAEEETEEEEPEPPKKLKKKPVPVPVKKPLAKKPAPVVPAKKPLVKKPAPAPAAPVKKPVGGKIIAGKKK